MKGDNTQDLIRDLRNAAPFASSSQEPLPNPPPSNVSMDLAGDIREFPPSLSIHQDNIEGQEEGLTSLGIESSQVDMMRDVLIESGVRVTHGTVSKLLDDSQSQDAPAAQLHSSKSCSNGGSFEVPAEAKEIQCSCLIKKVSPFDFFR